MALISHPALRAVAPPRFEEILLGYTQFSDPYYTLRRTVREMTVANLRKKPFFGFVFLSTPHFPYASLFPHYSRYAKWGYRGDFHFLKAYNADPSSEDDKEQIRALYAGGAAMSDDLVARMVELLGSRNAAVVVTADHGELLYDAPDVAMGHGDVLRYPHSYTVPLIFHDPAGRWPKGVVRDYVRSIDIAPTLVDLLEKNSGVRFPDPKLATFDIPGMWDGISLLDLDFGARGAAPFAFDNMAYSETEIWMTDDATGKSPRIPYPGITELLEPSPKHNGRLVLRRELAPLVIHSKYRMIRAGDFKFVFKPTLDGPIYELYDVRGDPEESTNIAGTRPDLLARFQDSLKKYLLGYESGFLHAD
jgi:hypothetical protein